MMLVIILSISLINSVQAQDKDVYQNEINWLLDRFKYQEIRGGTTKGLDVELDVNVSEYFKTLQNSNLDKEDKDRLAILSMVGEYKVGFEFLETFGSKNNYKLDKPYNLGGLKWLLLLKMNLISSPFNIL